MATEVGAASERETARGRVERSEATKGERSAIRRVAESKATAPHLYLQAEIRTARADLAPVVGAAARALREQPRLNGAYRDGAFETYSRVNVGVTIAGADGPLTPTIFDADDKDEGAIAAELDRLARTAADGTLTSAELAGGTFTLIAIDAKATRSLTPILGQGQAAALAIGPALERALAQGGTVAAGPVRTATLACDARIVQPDEGARFLDRVCELLQAGAESH